MLCAKTRPPGLSNHWYPRAVCGQRLCFSLFVCNSPKCEYSIESSLVVRAVSFSTIEIQEFFHERPVEH